MRLLRFARNDRNLGCNAGGSVIEWRQLSKHPTGTGFVFKSCSTIYPIVDKDPQYGQKYRSGLLAPTARKPTADFCYQEIRSKQMNEQKFNVKGLEMGAGSGYNGTDVLFTEGGTMTKLTATYPEDYVQEMAMEAFEVVMVCLRAHADAEVRLLAQAADACFLLWQLAGEESVIATQTIGEYLPMLIRVVAEGQTRLEACDAV